MISQTVKLGEVCDYSQDRIAVAGLSLENYFSTENMLTDKAGITVSNGLPDISFVSKYQPEDVLVSNIRPYFKKIWHADKIGGCSNDILIFRKKTEAELDAKFLYYVLADDRFFDYMMLSSKGTKMPRGDKYALLKYDFTLPPLPEQRRVAGILGNLDEKIENNRRLIRTLETLARTLFKKHITKNPERENWETSKVSETCDIISGGTPKTSVAEYWNGDIPWLSVADFGGGRHWVLDAEKHITQAGVDNSATNILEEGDIILSARGTVGEIAQLGKPMAFNQSCFGLRVRKHITQDYLWCFLKESVDELKRGSHGSTFDTINRSIFDRLSIKLPPAAVLKTFNAAVEPLFAEIGSLTRENQTLAALRDKLLRKLIK